MKGVFITFEGTEGAGKSLQSKMAYDFLLDRGFDPLYTREPGGTPISEKIRAVILDKENSEMNDMTEALLYAAARAQHVNEIIRPALRQGRPVVCDRYIDSSLAYQGVARGLGMERILALNNYAVDGLFPDLTFFIKLSPEIGLQRKSLDGEFDRLEQEALDFHNRVFQGYILLAKQYGDRIVTIDGEQPKELISSIILRHIKEILKIQ